MTPLERAARAIDPRAWEYFELNPGVTLNMVSPNSIIAAEIAPSLAIARIVLTAIREPSDEMITKGEAACFEWTAESANWQRDCFRTGFTAAIDKLLEEGA